VGLWERANDDATARRLAETVAAYRAPGRTMPLIRASGNHLKRAADTDQTMQLLSTGWGRIRGHKASSTTSSQHQPVSKAKHHANQRVSLGGSLLTPTLSRALADS
jgi:hypothetical protein